MKLGKYSSLMSQEERFWGLSFVNIENKIINVWFFCRILKNLRAITQQF